MRADSWPNSVGMEPVKLLVEKPNLESIVDRPNVLGMVPDKRFLSARRTSRNGHGPSRSIGPLNWLLERNNEVNEIGNGGTVEISELLDKASDLRFVKSIIESGMVPVKEFWCKYISLRCVSFVMHSGIDPVNLEAASVRKLSSDCSHNSSGIVPVKLLLSLKILRNFVVFFNRLSRVPFRLLLLIPRLARDSDLRPKGKVPVRKLLYASKICKAGRSSSVGMVPISLL